MFTVLNITTRLCHFEANFTSWVVMFYVMYIMIAAVSFQIGLRVQHMFK